MAITILPLDCDIFFITRTTLVKADLQMSSHFVQSIYEPLNSYNDANEALQKQPW